jgi:hypothetical protein
MDRMKEQIKRTIRTIDSGMKAGGEGPYTRAAGGRNETEIPDADGATHRR